MLDLSFLESQLQSLADLPLEERVLAQNNIKKLLHSYSPFKNEPVDLVTWEPVNAIEANDYNPNSVAPPEMKLLELSISEDGYTQPVVTFKEDSRIEVVDGFHRSRICRESDSVRNKVFGYIPVVTINEDREDKGDRIASTIRHNRARGKHKITAMSEIVVDLKKRNWSDEKIARELGMDSDEVLRLTQITGLAEMFQDKEFSEAWEITGDNNIEEVITDDQI